MTKVTKYYICVYKRGHGTKSSRCPTLEPLLFNSRYPHLTNNINSWPPDPVRKKLGGGINNPKNMTKVTKYYICVYKRGHGTKSSRCPTLEPLLFNSRYPHLTNNINSWPPDPVRKKLGGGGINNPTNMTKVTKYYICVYKRGHGAKSSRCPTLEPLLFNSRYPHLTNNINSWPPDPVRKKMRGK